ncbi:MAG: hypothetical protein CVV50_02550 [Spirochaetae bacterium HGW-Spirochaetae-6]|nr:MAG: hypothetical protein CVV50_02550 [Spirochaetae bacterium HGW-Spirochaetae-6]
MERVAVLDSLIPDDYRKRLFNRPLGGNVLKKKNKTGEPASKPVFQGALEEKGLELYESELDTFLGQLEQLEKNLLDKPNEETVRKYRRGMGDFLSKVSKNYAHFEFYKRKFGGQSKIKYNIWNVIDRDLEKLYQDVVKGQLKGFMLLDKLKEMKGLIIDLRIGEAK